LDRFKEEIRCDDCGSDYIITYSREDSIEYCPMCGADYFIDDEEDDDDFDYFDNDE